MWCLKEQVIFFGLKCLVYLIIIQVKNYGLILSSFPKSTLKFEKKAAKLFVKEANFKKENILKNLKEKIKKLTLKIDLN